MVALYLQPQAYNSSMDAAPSTMTLDLRIPWMNAAGSLGFAPEPRNPAGAELFGAFVTNPISPRPRRASRPPRFMRFPGGVLLHTGHPNPGLSAAIKRYAAAWARAPQPIIVHMQSAKPDELRKAVLRLEGLDNVIAVELGLDTDCSPQLGVDLVQVARGELPIVVQVPLPRALELAEVILENGASALSLGAPRGALPGADGKLVIGRLYGPAIFPQALDAVRELSKMKVPVIAAGGIQTQAQGEAMLSAGALAVQMDLGLWKMENSD
jgi:dihydroorotate dehydrogenase (NAD+) catalytic subunit